MPPLHEALPDPVRIPHPHGLPEGSERRAGRHKAGIHATLFTLPEKTEGSEPEKNHEPHFPTASVAGPGHRVVCFYPGGGLACPFNLGGWTAGDVGRRNWRQRKGR